MLKFGFHDSEAYKPIGFSNELRSKSTRPLLVLRPHKQELKFRYNCLKEEIASMLRRKTNTYYNKIIFVNGIIEIQSNNDGFLWKLLICLKLLNYLQLN